MSRVDFRVLRTLPLGGRRIRNVALGFAFLAAAKGHIERELIAAELGEELRKQNLQVPVLDQGGEKR